MGSKMFGCKQKEEKAENIKWRTGGEVILWKAAG